MVPNTSFPFLGFGLGYREPHKEDLLAGKTKAKWLEVVSENYMGYEGMGYGPSLQTLEKLRELYPIVFHSVSMSLGSTDPLNTNYFKRLKTLSEMIQPSWISDHLCWTGVHGVNSHDLLPLPYNQETVNWVASRISQVQDILQRKILIENVSSYIEYKHSEMSEGEFLKAVCEKADCNLLLDVNNIFVSCHNHNLNYQDYLKYIPWERVKQLHLAGPCESENSSLLIDTHDHPVHEKAWKIYRDVIRKAPNVSTMMEWDAHIPALATVEDELIKAMKIYEEEYGSEVLTDIPV